jgi:K+-transporting ATPase c subunit
MNAHLRANLWLLGLTLLICSVLYPLALWVFGQAAFGGRAQGSLVADGQGNAVGSRLIAQPFAGDEYFHPRPSAVSYNAAASGASNWGANNPALRARVAGQLASVLKYRDGRPVRPDVEAWVRERQREDPEAWPEKEGEALAATYFEKWWEAHPGADVEPVPADLVMASGSGLDPHVTLDGARYQLDRVAAAWAAKTGRDAAAVRADVEALLTEKASAPLGGLAGVPLVNVLELNLALRERMEGK